MHCLLLIYFNNKPLYVSSRHTGTLAVGSIGPDPANSPSTQRKTIPIAIKFLFYPKDAQLNIPRKMLKFTLKLTLKVLLHVSV
jgi:hypothetical protein